MARERAGLSGSGAFSVRPGKMDGTSEWGCIWHAKRGAYKILEDRTGTDVLSARSRPGGAARGRGIFGARLAGTSEVRCFRRTAGWNITDAELSARGWAQNRSRAFSARGRLKHSARDMLHPMRGWQMGGISKAKRHPIGAKLRKKQVL